MDEKWNYLDASRRKKLALAGIVAHFCSEKLTSAQSCKKYKIAGNGTFPGITVWMSAADMLDA